MFTQGLLLRFKNDSVYLWRIMCKSTFSGFLLWTNARKLLPEYCTVFHSEFKVLRKYSCWTVAIDVCKEWIVPCEQEHKQALGRSFHRFWRSQEFWLPPVYRPFFFFSPSNFKIKKGIKKKERKKRLPS